MTRHPQHNRSTCYFCHEPDEHILESHHIVPRRHGGSDDPENLVQVCPTCHQKLERLYDSRFYGAIGVEGDGGDDETDNSELRVEITDSDGGASVSLRDVIVEIGERNPDGAPIEEVRKKALKYGFDADRVEARIARLKQQGKVYEPARGHLRVTE